MSISTDRVDRLIGTDADNSGGINLPPLLSGLLVWTLDHESVTVDDVLEWAKRRMSVDRRRLQRNYKSLDAFPLLLRDVIDQMVDVKLLAPHPHTAATWVLGSAFMVNKKLTFIRKVGTRQAHTITVGPSDTRQEHDSASTQKAELISLVFELRPDGVGLRPVDPHRVTYLTESMEAFGYRQEQPVLVDQDGRILDGRHRMAAAKKLGINAPQRMVKVADSNEALVVSWIANESSPWSVVDRKRIAGRMMVAGVDPATIGSAIGPAGARNRARLQLLTDPLVSDRKVAVAAQASRPLVTRERTRMENEGEIKRTTQVHVNGDKREYEPESMSVLSGGTLCHPPSTVTEEVSGSLSEIEATPKPKRRLEPEASPRRNKQWTIQVSKRNDPKYLHDLLMVGTGLLDGHVITDKACARQLADMICLTLRENPLVWK